MFIKNLIAVIEQIGKDIKAIKASQLMADDVKNIINSTLVDGEEVRY